MAEPTWGNESYAYVRNAVITICKALIERQAIGDSIDYHHTRKSKLPQKLFMSINIKN